MDNNSNNFLKENTKEINKRKIDNFDLFFMMFMIFILLMTIIVMILILNRNQKNGMFVYVGKSKIQGEGLFTLKNVKKGDKLFMAIDDYNTITYFGTKINHCKNKPNTELIQILKEWYVFALYDIEKDTELLIDYNKAPDFIKRPDPSWTC
jgi:hypothetical protein